MAKALESGADAVIFDLEDSVPIAAKAEARKLVASANRCGCSRRQTRADHFRARQQSRDRPARRRSRCHRAAGPGRDLSAERRNRRRSNGLRRAARQARVGQRHESRHRGNRADDRERARRLSLLRSAQGLAARRPRPASAARRTAICRPISGCAWSIEGTELLYARSKVLLDTRAAGKLYPLDGVFSDLERRSGLASRIRGFPRGWATSAARSSIRSRSRPCARPMRCRKKTSRTTRAW